MSSGNFGAVGSATYGLRESNEAGPVLRPAELPRITPDIGTILSRRLAEEGVLSLDVSFESELRLLWSYFRHTHSPSFTPELLHDIGAVQRSVCRIFAEQVDPEAVPIRYMVWASRLPTIWNLGGDLRLFAHLIRERDRDRLLAYALEVVREGHLNAVNLHLPLITISLVQGDALGGGFEAALSSNLIVAERSAKFGLPEILFNLFPGMGAYTFLARRINPAAAERMIFSGKIYSAAELHEMGVVDVLADDGAGERALYDYIRRMERAHHTHCAIYRVRQRVQPITYEEMADIARIWVDTALNLQEADLRKMERLVVAQNRRLERLGASGQASRGDKVAY
ncbi:MAG TPA: crotonase/enoyl-CoA hydratase family protein [Alphaproteobacteria bacterium]|nr:crotonase/enoyl-CoA hydratase family protein [Alphaproteobacteria bacterium]